jgi:hypothetical protein
MTPEKSCPHAAFCVHPCDDDECFLETLEEPNGPAVPLTREQCVAFKRQLDSYDGTGGPNDQGAS